MATIKPIIALIFISSIFVVASADRSLLQGKKQFDFTTCAGAQQIGSAGKNLCCPLCWCVGTYSPNKMFAGAALQQFCKTSCAKCVAEANTCKSPKAPLPKTCQQGLQFNAVVKDLVTKCVNLYSSNPSIIKQAVGC